MAEFDYAKEFGTEYHRARQLPVAQQQWIASVRADKLRRWIAPEHRVLEYGVGFGWNLAAISCREKIGFDVANLRAEVEAKGITFESEEGSLPNGRFDIVLAHHVLENVPKPVPCLSRLRSLLSPTGKLLIFVPFERERKYQRFYSKNRAHHLYSWTPNSLARLVTSAGLTVRQTQVRRFRFDRLAAIITSKLGGELRLYRFLRAAGVLLLPEYELCMIAQAGKS